MKKILTIVLLMAAVCSLCIGMVGCSSTTQNSVDKTELEVETSHDPSVYDYGYFLVKDVTEDGKTTQDAVKLFKTHPSKDISTEIKEMDLNGKMNDIVTIYTNLDYYRNCILTQEEIDASKKEAQSKPDYTDGDEIYSTKKVTEMNVDFDKYHYTITNDVKDEGCFMTNSLIQNLVNCTVDKHNFETEQDYYNFTYLITKKTLSNLTDEEIQGCILLETKNALPDTLVKAAKDRNYDVLYDAIMNGIMSVNSTKAKTLVVHIGREKDIEYVSSDGKDVITETFNCFQLYSFKTYNDLYSD